MRVVGLEKIPSERHCNHARFCGLASRGRRQRTARHTKMCGGRAHVLAKRTLLLFSEGLASLEVEPYHWLCTNHPGCMTGRKRDNVTWADIEFRAIIHLQMHPPREDIVEMLDLTAFCTCAGLEVFIPLPTRLKCHFQDFGSSSSDHFSLHLGMAASLLRSRETLFLHGRHVSFYPFSLCARATNGLSAQNTAAQAIWLQHTERVRQSTRPRRPRGARQGSNLPCREAERIR